MSHFPQPKNNAPHLKGNRAGVHTLQRIARLGLLMLVVSIMSGPLPTQAQDDNTPLFTAYPQALIDCGTSPNSPLCNPQGSGWFGHDIAVIPDITGDGNQDFMVGAPNWRWIDVQGQENLPETSGSVFIFNGKPNGTGNPGTLAPLATGTDFDGILECPTGTAKFGWSVQGYDAEDQTTPDDIGSVDYFVGTLDYNRPNFIYPGTGGVFFFEDGGISAPTKIFRQQPLSNGTSGCGFGYSVALVDRHLATGASKRLAVGAPAESLVDTVPTPDQTKFGRVYQFTTTTPGNITPTPVPPLTSYTFVTSHAVLRNPPDGTGGLYGRAIAAIENPFYISGTTPHPHRGDFVVGASEAKVVAGGITYNGAGRVFVHTRNSAGDSSPGNYRFELLSPTPDTGGSNERSGAFGTSVCSVPDTNGDGYADIAVGAPGEDGFYSTFYDIGKVHVFSGLNGDHLLTLTNKSSGTGNAEFYSYFGMAIAGLNDIDGDGAGDLAIASPFSDVTLPGDTTKVNAGRVYIMSAGQNPPGGTANHERILRQIVAPTPIGGNGFCSHPGGGTDNICPRNEVGAAEIIDVYPGRPLARIADISGDGKDDILIGAETENCQGRVYAYETADSPTPTPSPTVSPSPTASPSPTLSPTASPTPSPTIEPSYSPTASPTASPTESPTASPTASPTPSPTPDTGLLMVQYVPGTDPSKGNPSFRDDNAATGRNQFRMRLRDGAGNLIAEQYYASADTAGEAASEVWQLPLENSSIATSWETGIQVIVDALYSDPPSGTVTLYTREISADLNHSSTNLTAFTLDPLPTTPGNYAATFTDSRPTSQINHYIYHVIRKVGSTETEEDDQDHGITGVFQVTADHSAVTRPVTLPVIVGGQEFWVVPRIRYTNSQGTDLGFRAIGNKSPSITLTIP